jgi:hypothetical protein
MDAKLASSLILNWLLGLALLTVAVLWLCREMTFATYRDGRPMGRILALQRAHPVFVGRESKTLGEYPGLKAPPAGAIALTLPEGTILQESVPHGMATLGKDYGRDYLLIIHSSESLDSTPSIADPMDDMRGWADCYYFDTAK